MLRCTISFLLFQTAWPIKSQASLYYWLQQHFVGTYFLPHGNVVNKSHRKTSDIRLNSPYGSGLYILNNICMTNLYSKPCLLQCHKNRYNANPHYLEMYVLYTHIHMYIYIPKDIYVCIEFPKQCIPIRHLLHHHLIHHHNLFSAPQHFLIVPVAHPFSTQTTVV